MRGGAHVFVFLCKPACVYRMCVPGACSWSGLGMFTRGLRRGLGVTRPRMPARGNPAGGADESPREGRTGVTGEEA